MTHKHEGPLGRALMNAFGLPRGLLGRLGGRLMVLEHRKIYPAVVERLAVAPGERILEIGCGSGAAAALVANAAVSGFVAAADPSEAMVAQTRRRLRASIAAGRAQVAQAPAESLPFPDRSFDAAFAIFSLHHWADRGRGLSEVLRVLRPGGRLVIAERLAEHDHGNEESRPAVSEEAVARYVSTFSEIGFDEVECAELELGRRKLMLIEARRPA